MAIERNIIRIDEALCNGCGQCVAACAEGALRLVDGKARLVGDIYCDGLGACIGDCPTGALTIEQREAGHFDEAAVTAALNQRKSGDAEVHGATATPSRPTTVIPGFESGQASRAATGAQARSGTGAVTPSVSESASRSATATEAFKIPGAGPSTAQQSVHGCPGSALRTFAAIASEQASAPFPTPSSQLTTWPIQLRLVPPVAPFLHNAHLLIAADCAPFAYADFHRRFLTQKTLLIGCPKLDDAAFYIDKLSQIFSLNEIASITVVIMEVPCCSGLVRIVREALDQAKRTMPFSLVRIGIRGQILTESEGGKR